MKYIIQIPLLLVLLLANCTAKQTVRAIPFGEQDEQRITNAADAYLNEKPETITAFLAERSAGGIHDYFSEGSFWWSNPEDPDGPYIRRDGERNPNNFKEHREARQNFSEVVTTLTAAYQITGDEKYALHAIAHLKAWYVNPATRMNPSLEYAQAIKGINTGRGIGIIDTRSFIDVALSARVLAKAEILVDEDLKGVKKWFNDYVEWLTTHPYGKEAQNHGNNHSTWWGAQVAAYAIVAERDDILKQCQIQFKNQLESQMAEDGSFPEELSRTKPFHYVNYNLRAWTSLALLASTPEENLWEYESKNGTLQKAIDFILPFYENPDLWKYQTEVEKEIHPERNDFLVFAYWGTGNKKCLELWKSLKNIKNKKEGRETNLLLWKNKISG